MHKPHLRQSRDRVSNLNGIHTARRPTLRKPIDDPDCSAESQGRHRRSVSTASRREDRLRPGEPPPRTPLLDGVADRAGQRTQRAALRADSRIARCRRVVIIPSWWRQMGHLLERVLDGSATVRAVNRGVHPHQIEPPIGEDRRGQGRPPVRSSRRRGPAGVVAQMPPPSRRRAGTPRRTAHNRDRWRARPYRSPRLHSGTPLWPGGLRRRRSERARRPSTLRYSNQGGGSRPPPAGLSARRRDKQFRCRRTPSAIPHIGAKNGLLDPGPPPSPTGMRWRACPSNDVKQSHLTPPKPEIDVTTGVTSAASPGWAGRPTAAPAGGEAHRGARVVNCLVDLDGKGGQRDFGVVERTLGMQTEPGKHPVMVAADPCHLSDHVADRCGVAEERAALRSDVAVQPSSLR